MIALAGCSGSGKKEIITRDFCEKFYPLKRSPAVDKDLMRISNDLFTYIQINETAHICFCKPIEEQAKCIKEAINEN